MNEDHTHKGIPVELFTTLGQNGPTSRPGLVCSAPPVYVQRVKRSDTYFCPLKDVSSCKEPKKELAAAGLCMGFVVFTATQLDGFVW